MMPAIRTSIVVVMLAWLAAALSAQAPSRGNSAATITGAFADSCRSFAARSSKDISYVDVHHVSGVAAKDETIGSPEYVIEGGAGEEIAFAVVKSGTTTEAFDCVPSNSAPTALLEIQTPPVDQTLAGCYPFWAGGWSCESSTPRTAWTNGSEVPDTGGTDSGLLHWVCGDPFPCTPNRLTVTFRGIGSSDPDGDLASWTLDFGDGTSVSGTWGAPPTEVVHDYVAGIFGVVTLTVTDSAGHSDSDVIRMVFLDLTRD